MLSSEVREKVTEFVESNISLSELEEWLVPRLPSFMREPYSADSDVVAEIELGLAEINDGIRTTEELRNNLKRVLENHSLQFVLTLVDRSQHSEVRTGSSGKIYSPSLAIFDGLTIAV